MAAAQPIRNAGKNKAEAHAETDASGRITPLRELQLLELHRAGGPGAQAALGELVRGYQRRIYSICLRMVRNRDDASELTQDALIKVIEGLPGYSGQSKLSTWVIRVTMNCCLSHLRKQKLRHHESLDSPARGESGATSSDPAGGHASGALRMGFSGVSGGREPMPSRRIEQEQDRETLLTALEGLDDEMRAILVLRDLQDLDYQQLSDVLDVPIGTVKSRLFRARAALRHAIEATGRM